MILDHGLDLLHLHLHDDHLELLNQQTDTVIYICVIIPKFEIIIYFYLLSSVQRQYRVRR